MRTSADTAFGSAVGLAVLAAMFIAIWAARDTNARVGTGTGAAALEANAQGPRLHSARTHRSPVTRTSITPEQVKALQGR
jgi:hypothetical protein